MEHAAFIWRLEDLRFCSPSPKIDRIYFGHEFCERLIPTSDHLNQVVQWATDRSCSVTLVLPFLSNQGLVSALSIIESFLGMAPNHPELVINDWGLAYHLSSLGFSIDLVLGRLLTKQKRGPRIIKIKNKVPQTMIEHFKTSNIEVPHYQSWLEDNLNIKRVELDNLLQGIDRSPGLPASLYYPYAYVTATRQCLAARCESPGRNPREIKTCNQECRRYVFKLEHPDMPVPLYVRGNAQFFKNEHLPDNLEALGIDRLVRVHGILPDD